MTVLLIFWKLFKNYVINPCWHLLLNKTHTIDVKQKHHFKILLKFNKLFVVTQIFYYYELLFLAFVCMDNLTSWGRLKISLILLLTLEEFFFHKFLAPSTKCDPIVRLISSKKIFKELCMFETQLLLLLFLLRVLLLSFWLLRFFLFDFSLFILN